MKKTVTTAAATLAALTIGSGLAYAAPGPGQNGAPGEGSLTIHKLVGAEGAAGTGEELTDLPADTVPLGGVDFTIWQLGTDNGGTCTPLDMANASDWTTMTDLGVNGKAPTTLQGVKDAGFCVVPPEAGTTSTTTANGIINFSDLNLGLYYVQETDASGAYTLEGGEQVPQNVTGMSKPFYVTVPLANGTDWLYDVHAYPKNQVTDQPTKIINSDENQSSHGYTIGDEVQYTINQTVPALNAGETYDSASVWDYLPAELAYKGTTSVKLGDETLVEDTDYTIDSDGVTWSLTATGLGKLTAGANIEVIFTTTVVSVPASGEIANPGSVDPDTPGYGSEFNGNKIPGEKTPYTYWGQLKVNKVDQSTPAQGLAGAEFEIYPVPTTGGCEATTPTGDPISTGVSDNTGLVLWDNTNPSASPLGLWVANSDNGSLDNPSREYCLYEVKAPSGYIGTTGAITATITPGTTFVVDGNDLTVENKVDNGNMPKLPMTGAAGTIMLLAGGAVLLVIGTSFYVLRRKAEAKK